MPIYTPYFIFLVISALSFFIALIALGIRKSKWNLPLSNDKPIRITMGIVVLYYAIKFIFGWRFSSWYFEAFLILCTCFTMDYFVIFKRRYPFKSNTTYYFLRIFSFTLPTLALGVMLLITVVTFGYGALMFCYVLPTDRTYGEQWIYKNLYMYKNDCEGGIVFKKKFLFFEKELTSASGRFLIGKEGIPATGFIERNNNDTIYISGRNRRTRYTNCLRITILKPYLIKIEEINPDRYQPDNGKINLNIYNEQFIKL